ncbi:hypothetical protein ACXPWS_04530 [Mycobacterium sp. BMJ-28]
MTLIQTVFSNDRVIQVSDRRLTKGKGELVDDFYTKWVLWNERYTVGFTGIARLDRQQKKESTAQWIAELLSDYALFEHGVLALHAALTPKIKKLPKNFDRRLAIVLAGFDEFHNGPLVACVTNMDMQTYRSADPINFEIWKFAIAPGQSAGVHSVGAPMNEQQSKLLVRNARQALKKGDGVNSAVRVMVGIQRDVAKKDKTVGPDALVVHIPRKQNPPGGPAATSNLGGSDIPATGTSFGFLDRNGWQWKQEAPLSAGDGFVRKFWASADPEHPDNQSISMQLLKVPKGWGDNPDA